MTGAQRPSRSPLNPTDTPAQPAVESSDGPKERLTPPGRPDQPSPPGEPRLDIPWDRLSAIGANTDLREMLEHVLDPSWEGIGPNEVGEVILQAATQAAVLDYLDWYFGAVSPPEPDALPAIYQAVVAGAASAVDAAVPEFASLGPDVIALLDQVLGQVPQDHPLATSVLQTHAVLATWRDRELADGRAAGHAAQQPEATGSERAAVGQGGNAANRLYAAARQALRDDKVEVALEQMLAGTLAALQGARLWFGWNHEFAGKPLERPLQDGLALVALVRRIPSCPFPLRSRFEDEQHRWRDVVLTGRYVDFESLARPHTDQLMRGPTVTAFLRSLANDGRDLDSEDLVQSLSQLDSPAREQVWLYLYFNAAYIGPSLLGRSPIVLQLALLDLVDTGACWSREIAEALLDDLTYHPPAAGSGVMEDGADESASDDSAEPPAPEGNPDGGEPRVPIAVRARAAAVLAQRLLDDPALGDVLADTMRYAGYTPVGRWLRSVAPGEPSPLSS